MKLFLLLTLVTVFSLGFSAKILKNKKKFSSGFVCPSNGLFANPYTNQCNTYYNCGNGVATLQSCPWPLVFHSSVNACDKPTSSDCIQPNVVCPSDGVQPNPAQQSSFFLCGNGVATLMQCPNGLLYNPNVKACDFASNVPYVNVGCDQGWNGWTIFSTPYGTSVDCAANPWTYNFYVYDVTGETYVYCWGTEPVLGYCCNNMKYNVSLGYCI